jgi:hypothetical protein
MSKTGGKYAFLTSKHNFFETNALFHCSCAFADLEAKVICPNLHWCSFQNTNSLPSPLALVSLIKYGLRKNVLLLLFCFSRCLGGDIYSNAYLLAPLRVVMRRR